MAIKSDIPQINTLRLAVEKYVGFKMHTHTDFIELVDQIEKQLHEHISESTLERLWKYSTRSYKTVSIRTLDVLAEFSGYLSWDNFCSELETISQEEYEIVEEVLYSDTLSEGQILKITWLPNKTIKIKYLGNNQYVILNSENSKLVKGDTFYCLSITIGQEMRLEHVHKQNEDENLEEDENKSLRYIIGRKHGITSISFIDC